MIVNMETAQKNNWHYTTGNTAKKKKKKKKNKVDTWCYHGDHV